MKFTIALIAKNEEKTLPRLLESTKGVDEIILCDTGSTDKTIEVAKSYGVTVYEKNFDEVIDEEMAKTINSFSLNNDEGELVKVGEKCFNFSKARNWIANKAKNNMIFMPDCDEVVEWDLEEIEKVLETTDRLEYNFIFSFDSEGRPVIQFLHSKFYNRDKLEWVRNIHEIIVDKNKHDYNNDVEGWTSQKELSFLHNTAKDMETIVEIGSWKGRSTKAILSGTKGTVYAVDHFLGSKGEEEQHKEAKEDVVYNQFLENTKGYDNLKVLRMSSEEAVKQFEDKSIDMLFIDAEHTYEGVKEDIKLWLPKVKKIVCGHDYCDVWEGVKKAVDESIDNFETEDSIWFKSLDGIRRGPIKTTRLSPDKILLKHYQNVETNRTQYLRGLAVDFLQNEYNDRNCHYFARELIYKGFYKTAIDFFRKHISNPGWSTEQGQSYIYIGDCYKYMGDVVKAMENYAIGFTYDMNRREPLINMVDILIERKQYAESERLLKLALTIPKGNYYSNFEPNYTHIPHHLLSLALYYQGKKDESKEHLLEAIKLDPKNKLYKENIKYY